MKPQFISKLVISLMISPDGMPLFNRSGSQLWQLSSDLGFASNVLKTLVKVPRGFVTDFASVPKVPLVYEVLGGIAQMPATIHDYLYSTGSVSRIEADNVLLEAMEVTGVSWFKRKLIYAGVRVGGAAFYRSNQQGK